MRHVPRLSVLLISLALPATVWAEHAKITLDVTTPAGQETAFVDQTPPAFGKNPRPVVKAKAGEPIKSQFMLTNVYPHKTLENVVVHFFVARQSAVGSKEPPDLSHDVVTESAFEIDLKPGAKVGQRNSFRIDQPGAYLVRIETRLTQSDHEHFAAIDLVIEGNVR
ncbi:MAG: hypothetical protein AB7I30_07820 [Isosphaeraceae bacterium]